MNYRDLGIKTPDDYGRKRGNPYVRDSNLLKLEHEDTIDTPVSLDVITISTSAAKEISEVTIDGVTYVLTEAVSATHPSKLKEILELTMENAFDTARASKTMGDQEIYTKIAVDYDGTDTNIYHLGLLELTSVKEGANTISATRKSTQFTEGLYEVVFAAAASVDVVYDGTTEGTVDCTDAATAKTSLIAAFSTLGLTQYDVVVEDVAGTSNLKATVYLDGQDEAFSVAGVDASYVSSIINFK